MVKIRPFRIEDSSSILEIYAPFITNGGVSFETTVPPLPDFEIRLKTIAAKYPFLVAEIDHKVAGYAYAGLHRDRDAYKWIVETSVYLHPDFRKQGLGEQLYQQLFDILQQRNFVWAYAGITQPNESSMALHTKMGFSVFATYLNAGWKNGQWYDVVWLRKPVNQASSPPPEPIFGPME